MKYRVIGKSQVKLDDGSFADVDEVVDEKLIGASRVQAYLYLEMIEPAPMSKATKKADDKPAAKGAVSTKMTRPKLNKLAKKAGVESPESLPNKQAVVDAINAAG